MCKHDVLKMKVLVPPDQTIRQCILQSGNLLSAVVAVVKEKQKQGQYTVWFRSGDELKFVTFRMLHTCQLRIERTEKDAVCPCYSQNSSQNQISNIIYSKQATPEIVALSR